MWPVSSWLENCTELRPPGQECPVHLWIEEKSQEMGVG